MIQGANGRKHPYQPRWCSRKNRLLENYTLIKEKYLSGLMSSVRYRHQNTVKELLPTNKIPSPVRVCCINTVSVKNIYQDSKSIGRRKK